MDAFHYVSKESGGASFGQTGAMNRERDPVGDPGAEPGRRVGVLVLAAGAGRRFGGGKQLAPLAGRPLLEHALANAAAIPAEHFVVVLGSEAEGVAERVPLHGFEPLVCPGWEAGMAEPLKLGIAALAACDAIVILLGDQPLIGPEAARRLLARRRPGRAALRATYGGRPGHPVLIERSLYEAVAALSGDAGARDLLAGDETAKVPCEDLAHPLDVDSPADLKNAERAVKGAP